MLMLGTGQFGVRTHKIGAEVSGHFGPKPVVSHFGPKYKAERTSARLREEIGAKYCWRDFFCFLLCSLIALCVYGTVLD